MADMPRQLPPEVSNALAKGNLIEAMRLLRAQYKDVGLAEARGLLEALQRQGQVKARVQAQARARPAAIPRYGPKLSPGEVPRGAGPAGMAVGLMIAAAAVAAIYFKFF